MKPLQSILDRIETSKDKYDQCQISFVSDQSEILRDLSSAYYDLTEHLIEEKERSRSFYFQSTASSHAAKEREVDMKCPELYHIRKVMEATEKLIDCVRSTLSKAKNG